MPRGSLEMSLDPSWRKQMSKTWARHFAPTFQLPMTEIERELFTRETINVGEPHYEVIIIATHHWRVLMHGHLTKL